MHTFNLYTLQTPYLTVSMQQHYADRAIMLPSARPSHGWISQKRLKLGLWNFHRTVYSLSSFAGVSLMQKF